MTTSITSKIAEINGMVLDILTDFAKEISKKYNIPLEGENGLEVILDTIGSNPSHLPSGINNRVIMSSPATPTGLTCCAEVGSGGRKGMICGAKVSPKSLTQTVCGRHMTKETDISSNISKSSTIPINIGAKSPIMGSTDNICYATLSSGPNKGSRCSTKISDKSVTRKYCGRHMKAEVGGISPSSSETSGSPVSQEEIPQPQIEPQIKKEEIKKEVVRPSKSLYKTEDGKNQYILVIEDCRFAFNIKTKKVCNIEVIISEEEKTSKLEILTEEHHTILNNNKIPFEC